MIKLICPKCSSDKIYYHDEKHKKDTFKCDSCNKQFTTNNAEWEQE